jgi:hypothetical protein
MVSVRVSVEAGHFTGPDKDGTNGATFVNITQATTRYVLPRLLPATVAAQINGGVAGAVLGLLVFYILCGVMYAWYRSCAVPRAAPASQPPILHGAPSAPSCDEMSY